MPSMAHVAGAVTVGLVVAHLVLVRTDEGERGPPAAPSASEADDAPRPMAERLEEQQQLRMEARQARNASLLDDSTTRDAKRLTQTLSLLGESPVEMVGVDGQPEIRTGKTVDDLRSFLQSGGSYSGPLPEPLARELQSAKEER